MKKYLALSLALILAAAQAAKAEAWIASISSPKTYFTTSSDSLVYFQRQGTTTDTARIGSTCATLYSVTPTGQTPVQTVKFSLLPSNVVMVGCQATITGVLPAGNYLLDAAPSFLPTEGMYIWTLDPHSK